jgi:TRAP-type C4-dicarboxylate transport system substrate-binding protein
MKQRPMSLLVAALAAAMVIVAKAEEPMLLKYGHWVPPKHPISTVSVAGWIEAVERDSGGTIKFAVFPAGQLGKPQDHFDLAQKGIADVTWHNPGFNPGRFPIFGAVEIPMMVKDTLAGAAVLTDWYRPYAEKEMAGVKFCYASMMYPLGFHGTKKIEKPSDLKGMKIRPSTAAEAMYIKQAGGAAVPGAFPTTRDLIGKGVADGTSGTFGSLMAFGIDKVTSHHLAIPFAAAGYVVVINKGKYESMSPKQKAAIDKNCTGEAGTKFTAPLHAFEEGGMKKLIARKDPGRTIVLPTPEIMDAWRVGVAPVREAWAKEASAKGGIDANKALDELRAALKAKNALVD